MLTEESVLVDTLNDHQVDHFTIPPMMVCTCGREYDRAHHTFHLLVEFDVARYHTSGIGLD